MVLEPSDHSGHGWLGLGAMKCFICLGEREGATNGARDLWWERNEGQIFQTQLSSKMSSEAPGYLLESLSLVEMKHAQLLKREKEAGGNASRQIEVGQMKMRNEWSVLKKSFPEIARD